MVVSPRSYKRRASTPVISPSLYNSTSGPNEERYLLAEQLSVHSYFMPCTFQITGIVDAVRLEAALQLMNDRHDALRTGFRLDQSGQWFKYVVPYTKARLDIFEIPGADIAQLKLRIHEHFFRKPDFSPESLHGAVLIRRSKLDWVFSFSQHHCISDARSMMIFSRELFALYQGCELSSCPPGYSASLNQQWRSGQNYERSLQFFSKRVSDLGTIAHIVDDRANEAASDAIPSVSILLENELVEAATSAANGAGVTLFTFFYAAVIVLLARATGVATVLTAFQSHGRRNCVDSTECFGPFSNALVVASCLDGAMTMRELLTSVRNDIHGALLHESVPYHHVIRATGIRPLFGINWYPTMPDLRVPGLVLSEVDISDRQSDYDLNFRFVQRAKNLELIIYYRSNGISGDRVQSYAHSLALLSQALAQDLDAKISASASCDFAPRGSLSLFSEPLRHNPEVTHEAITTAFVRAAAARPNAVAVISGKATYSYGDVAERSRIVANQILSAGMGRGDRIAIIAGRTPELIWSILGVARAGAIFIIIDHEQPLARITALLDVCAPTAILTDGGSETQLIGSRLSMGRGIVFIDEIAYPVDPDELSGLDDAAPDGAAYFLFTSGTTGRPKCIACSHLPLVHFVAWQAKVFGLNSGDRFTMLSGLGHDPLLRDIFSALSVGAAVTIPGSRCIHDPGGLHRWFVASQPTITHLTPAMGQLLIAGGRDRRTVDSLRKIFWGGDLLDPLLVASVQVIAPVSESINFYGSTETPQAAGFFRWDGDRGRKSVPVGTGTDGFQLGIVDADRRQLGIGEVGEIAVRSCYLSMGTVIEGRMEALSEEASPHTYYTGDSGFHLPNGNIVVLGRSDEQVKVRGYRVNLREINAALREHPAVRTAATVAVGSGHNLKIVAFVVLSQTPDLEAKLFFDFLRDRLASYMLPNDIRVRTSLPLLSNGKIDRQALRSLADERAGPLLSRPKTRERQIIAAWMNILSRDDFDASVSFSQLGGDSLSYVEVYLATENIIGVVPENWPFMSIADLVMTERESSWFSVVETSMLIRALSIVLVVAGHFGFVRYGGGATSGLFLVSGFLFGGFQLNEAFARLSAAPLLKLVFRIAVPVFLYSLIFYAYKSLTGDVPAASTLLFNADFVDYRKLGTDFGGNRIYLWYIHCSLQIIIALWFSVAILQATKLLRIGQWNFLVVLFTFACLARWSGLIFSVGGWPTHGVEELDPVRYWPSTHMATFLLGAIIAILQQKSPTNGHRNSVILACLVGLYAALTVPFLGIMTGSIIFVSSISMIFLNRVLVPRVLSRLILTLSGSSLFIYLTHRQTQGALKMLGLPFRGATTGIYVVSALAVGVLAWLVWQKMRSAVRNIVEVQRRRAHQSVPSGSRQRTASFVDRVMIARRLSEPTPRPDRRRKRRERPARRQC